MKLREKYVLLVVAAVMLVALGFLLVALRRDDSLPAAAAADHRQFASIRDSANRWAAMVMPEEDEFERIQADLRANSTTSRDPVGAKRDFFDGMMKFAWRNYRRFAWGDNEFRPVSRIAHTASVFGAAPLGATIVDGIDTLWIMGLREEFEEAREWIRTDFDLKKARDDLSVFETNIRFVGGLLSTYALTNDTLFLEKAREVADLLLPAFNTPTGVPMTLVNPKTGKTTNWGWASGGCSILSELGSLELEFNYLSRATGNQTYAEKVARVRNLIDTIEKPDGLYPNYLNPRTGKFCQKHVSVGALGDSFYEYLLKAWIWSGRRDANLKRMYDQATEALERNLLFKSKQSQLWYFADMKGTRVDHKMDHLACFIAGMYALQAKNEWEPEKAAHALEMAKQIGRTCHESYARTATGIGPEAFRFTNDVEARALRDNERYYILRPEVVEGWFFLWRVTGDQQYRDWCWAAVQAIDKYCRVENGYSGIKFVDRTDVIHDDVQQSFFLAETLKYLFLVFTDDQIPLERWVFNTEAHPFPIESADDVGPSTLQSSRTGF